MNLKGRYKTMKKEDFVKLMGVPQITNFGEIMDYLNDLKDAKKYY